MSKHIILVSSLRESPIDENHQYITIGPNCWGASATSWQESFKNAKKNCPRRHNRLSNFLTRVAPKGAEVSGFDGYVSWPQSHDAKECPFCTVGKGVVPVFSK